MKERIEALKHEIERALSEGRSLKDIKELQVRFLGRKGPIQELMLALRETSAEERPSLGQQINRLKEEVTEALHKLEKNFSSSEEEERLRQETLDVTLPGSYRPLGRKHPVSAMLDLVLEAHRDMGFSVQYGPDIESDFYNFEALNFAPDHPARDMHDTYYIEPGVLLRTHTSNTQVRLMEGHPPPIRIAAPGRCFRNEDITARSHLFFHQVEGIYIDRGVSMSDLVQTLEDLLHRIFSTQVKLRLRSSYFPFVEPGLEVDISCLACSGKGCTLCKKSGWLEVLGAGMVHPEVLKSGGIDPEEYTGYAWGMGIERLVLLKYGIDDIRLLFDGDVRLLRQFSFV
ncbi:MAG: phenylalanine--tRNA ligase subunit alpha [Verrucomicrobia bacterium]|nr:phenylalanine--tRNA ligase subunit alpha [Verrucomicrobiota bacterium]